MTWWIISYNVIVYNIRFRTKLKDLYTVNRLYCILRHNVDGYHFGCSVQEMYFNSDLWPAVQRSFSTSCWSAGISSCSSVLSFLWNGAPCWRAIFQPTESNQGVQGDRWSAAGLAVLSRTCSVVCTGIALGRALGCLFGALHMCPRYIEWTLIWHHALELHLQ